MRYRRAAQRVVSLAPHTTELAYAAGMGAVLVAASDWSDYPPAARHLERVASWQGVNIERILALKPDLVLGWRGGNPQRALETLAAFGIPVVTLDPQSIDEMAGALNTLASYSPHPEQARQAAHALEDQQATLRQRYAGGAPLRVFLQFGSRPQLSAPVLALNEDSFTRPGPRILLAAQQLCTQLAPIRAALPAKVP
ncbi:helical backbone metal receptor [Sodalis glossinidius]|uniref:helical backbone metal receptor n=1 Tax=Sodalis glossinidius TaxID=63612 RepID=UPI00141373DE|nr:helical backbone metal receptor [Sodalis glossinidius]